MSKQQLDTSFMAYCKHTDYVLAGVKGHIGHIHLNRPSAINSLNEDMCYAITSALKDFEEDSNVHAVILSGEGKGFCAGGDVIAVRQEMLQKFPVSFFRVEYELNQYMAKYSKPIISLMAGIVMGGGLGLGVPTSHRVVTPSTLAAMPEGKIGLFPDVGITWYLSRLEDETGTWFALSSTTVGPVEAIALGLADVMIEDEDIPRLVQRLYKGEKPDKVLADMGSVPEPFLLDSARPWINECFQGDDIVKIMERLQSHSNPDARGTYSNMKTLSPLTLAVGLEAMRDAKETDSIQDVLNRDMGMAYQFTHIQSDFCEGVRAQLVDKDRNPQWIHDDVSGVSEREVDALFANSCGRKSTRVRQRFSRRA